MCVDSVHFWQAEQADLVMRTSHLYNITVCTVSITNRSACWHNKVGSLHSPKICLISYVTLEFLNKMYKQYTWNITLKAYSILRTYKDSHTNIYYHPTQLHNTKVATKYEVLSLESWDWWVEDAFHHRWTLPTHSLLSYHFNDKKPIRQQYVVRKPAESKGWATLYFII